MKAVLMVRALDLGDGACRAVHSISDASRVFDPTVPVALAVLEREGCAVHFSIPAQAGSQHTDAPPRVLQPGCEGLRSQVMESTQHRVGDREVGDCGPGAVQVCVWVWVFHHTGPARAGHGSMRVGNHTRPVRFLCLTSLCMAGVKGWCKAALLSNRERAAHPALLSDWCVGGRVLDRRSQVTTPVLQPTRLPLIPLCHIPPVQALGPGDDFQRHGTSADTKAGALSPPTLRNCHSL